MPDKKPAWTPHQTLAIETTDRSVLVSASAGTGKTAVLARRCANILADQTHPTDASQVLVLTFTDASAEEMRSRIAAQLLKKFKTDPSHYLRHQILKLDAANISTIHSFCKRTITEHFFELGIDPTCRIIDPDEQNLLKSDTLTLTVEQAWADPQLAQALDILLYGRKIQNPNTGFLNRIVDLSDLLDATLSPHRWYETANALADFDNVLATDLCKTQKQMILDKLNTATEQLNFSIALEQRLWSQAWCTDKVLSVISTVDACTKLVKADNFQKCYEMVAGFTGPRFTRPKDMSKEIADTIRKPYKDATRQIKDLKNLAIINPRYQTIVHGTANLQTKLMAELVKRFRQNYATAKSKLNGFDFADLEHLTIRLFKDSPHIAERLTDKFKFIFVDEYQDINNLQKAIIDNLSRPDNLFVVGDIKQSIYEFRQAKPQLFLDQLLSASTDPADDAPLRVDLTDNFRTRKPLLDFVNAVFARIMKKSFAHIDYDHTALLTPGFDYEPIENIPSLPSSPVEMYILDDEPGEDDLAPSANRTTATERQAAFIAKRIAELVTAESPMLKIFDKRTKAYRPAEYRDIAILMRSPSHRANQYTQVLQLAGIPVNSQSSAGYFAATEITDCISLLKILDNPQRDIEFAAVLRSPFFRITDTQLTLIRSHCTADSDKDRSFYDHAKNYAQDGPDKTLRDKLCNVLTQLENWQLIARRQSLSDLIWKILRQTGYLSFVSALPSGRQRRANLLKLHDRAIQFEGFATAARTTSMTRFVEFIEKLLDRDRDWAPARCDDSTENAVTIMSIHKSKGLEFPIVFLAELSTRFNTKDFTGTCLADQENTIGLQIVDPETKTNLPTIAHQVIAEKKRRTMIAEEMRILYVAMTRARERLILTTSVKASSCANTLSALSLDSGPSLEDFQITAVSSHFDWILRALANHKDMQKLFDIPPTENSVRSDLFYAELIDRRRLDDLTAALLQRPDDSLQTVAADSSTQKLLEQITSSLNWKYPFVDLTKIQAKLSVSALTHSQDEFAPLKSKGVFDRLPLSMIQADTAKRSSPPATVLGSATHLVIQKLDLSQDVTAETIHSTIQQLTNQQTLSPELAACIDIHSILAFFQSDIGKLALAPDNKTMREWPFTYAIDAAEIGAITDTEIVIVQGIIDMIVRTPKGLVVIDFKTDRVTAAQTPERAKIYQKQINLYARAAQAILKQKTIRTALYFLKPACSVDTET